MAIDYKSLGQIGDDKHSMVTVLVMKYCKAGNAFSHCVETKGIEEQCIIRQVVEDNDILGDLCMFLKSD